MIQVHSARTLEAFEKMFGESNADTLVFTTPLYVQGVPITPENCDKIHQVCMEAMRGLMTSTRLSLEWDPSLYISVKGLKNSIPVVTLDMEKSEIEKTLSSDPSKT